MRRPLVLSLVALAAAATSASAAITSTQTIIYHAFTTSGQPAVKATRTVSGSCFTGSIAANRSDAWRCTAGNLIHDPCFSSPMHTAFVLCPASPWKSTGIKINLTKKLPAGNKPGPSTKGLPWGIELLSGRRCTLIEGASVIVQGRRANYGCRKSKNLLWGAPSRKTSVWTILSARASAKTLHKKVKINIAYF